VAPATGCFLAGDFSARDTTPPGALAPAAGSAASGPAGAWVPASAPAGALVPVFRPAAVLVPAFRPAGALVPAFRPAGVLVPAFRPAGALVPASRPAGIPGARLPSSTAPFTGVRPPVGGVPGLWRAGLDAAGLPCPAVPAPVPWARRSRSAGNAVARMPSRTAPFTGS
jgi:hypothetical protein